MRKKFSACLLLAVSLVAVGCSGGSDASGDGAGEKAVNALRDTSYTAEINYDEGTVTLPLDKYFMTRIESGIEWSANILKTHLCIDSKGFPGEWSPIAEPTTEEWERYGRWNLENAEKYGYMSVPDPGLDSALAGSTRWAEKHADVLNTPEYIAARDECATGDPNSPINAMAVEDWAPDEVKTMRGQSYDLMLATDEAKAVIAEWDACVIEAGFEVTKENGPLSDIVGVSYDEADEVSIKAAIRDVECKKKTDFMQRLADIEASFQGPLVEKYKAELVAQRAEIDVRMQNVYEYLKKNTAAGVALASK